MCCKGKAKDLDPKEFDRPAGDAGYGATTGHQYAAVRMIDRPEQGAKGGWILLNSTS
jgi:hypothetical protein